VLTGHGKSTTQNVAAGAANLATNLVEPSRLVKRNSSHDVGGFAPYRVQWFLCHADTVAHFESQVVDTPAQSAAASRQASSGPPKLQNPAIAKRAVRGSTSPNGHASTRAGLTRLPYPVACLGLRGRTVAAANTRRLVCARPHTEPSQPSQATSGETASGREAPSKVI